MGRVERLRNQSINSEPEIFAERAVLVTESYRQTDSFSSPLRRALALKHILENMTVVVNEDELIVGEKTLKYRGSPLYPELYCMSVEELESIGKRELAPFKVSDQTKSVLTEKVIPYWQGKTMYDKIMAVMDETWKQGLENGVFSEYSLSRAPGHVNLDGKVVQKGLIGLRKEVEESLKNIDDCSPNCYQQMQELGAMKIAIDAAISFARRHAPGLRNWLKQRKTLEEERS